ncbi:DUF4352 domain-containing protein [Lentibacillus sp. N15]|uniref:DUF4352 domain-containing protein n=1 Tax=Lentibacillus songyuanensis TaxID=3136161 RepID=UPI0031BABB3C
MKKFTFMALFLILSLSILLAACGESAIEKADGKTDDSKASEDKDKGKEEKSKDKETENLKVGETVTFDGVDITLNEARIEPGGEFDEPENEQFIVVNLTAENNTDEEVTMSSMMNVELYDDEGYNYSTTILTEGAKGQFDGSVPAGNKLRGEIPFDVPKSDAYELHFSDPFQSGKAIWKITADELK